MPSSAIARVPRRRNGPRRRLDPNKLHTQLWSGNFRRTLLQQAIELEQSWAASDRSDDVRYLQAKCVVAEIFDYFGLYQDALRVLEPDGADIQKLVDDISESTASLERPLWKQRIWVLINYAHAYYRAGDYRESLKLLGDCQRGLDTLDRQTARSLGTRARLQYSLGQVFRQLNELDKAESAFLAAMKHADHRLRDQIDGQANERRIDSERKLANWTIGKCLALGLGWIRYTQGQLSGAEPLIIAGRTFLRGTNDTIHKTYTDLLYGSILRAQAGLNAEKLKQAIRVLEIAHFTFAKWGHVPYRARAAFELSLAFLHLRDFAAATQRLNEVRATAQAGKDRRWLCNAAIVESRILREQGNWHGAREAARLAIREAHFASETFCYIDALIASGEAAVACVKAQRLAKESSELAEARRCFEEAAQLAANNAKVKAICCVHQARMYACVNDHPRAHAALRRYEALKRDVESGFVHDMARQVYEDLDSRAFIIISSTETLDYDFWRQRLQELLLEQAQRRTNGSSHSAIAEQLGISRQTLYAWLAANRGTQKPND